MSEDHPAYLKALGDTSKYQNPVGFSNHTTANKSETTLIRQNNTIIALLLEVSQKLDKLLKEKETIPDKTNNIDDLINKLNNIEITPRREKQIKKLPKWTFFQLGEEEDKETQKKKDQTM